MPYASLAGRIFRDIAFTPRWHTGMLLLQEIPFLRALGGEIRFRLGDGTLGLPCGARLLDRGRLDRCDLAGLAGWHHGCVIFSVVCVLVRCLPGCLMLQAGLLVLRHENAVVLRRRRPVICSGGSGRATAMLAPAPAWLPRACSGRPPGAPRHSLRSAARDLRRRRGR